MFFNNYVYFATIGLQAFCAYHCFKRGTQQRWIWLIVFLPVVGSLIYIYSEMMKGNEISQVQSGVSSIIDPGGRIRKLELNLKFADTFNNRVMLADAYLNSGQHQKAIELYESSLTGNFVDNEQVLSPLIVAYYFTGRYQDIPALVKKIQKSNTFPRSKAHICYILSLEKTGQMELAESEFKSIQGRYSNFEARYEYAMFLKRAGRNHEAKEILAALLDEVPHLSGVEKRHYRLWFAKSKEAMNEL